MPPRGGGRLRSFLQYLLSAGKIPAATLLAAQLEQLRRLPAPAELAGESGLLSPEQLLAVLLKQAEGELSFFAACRELGLPEGKLREAVDARYATLRTPLLELLRADASVSAGTLDSLWAEYQAGGEAVASAPIAPPFAAPASALTLVPAEPEPAAAGFTLAESGDPLLDLKLKELTAYLNELVRAEGIELITVLTSLVHGFHNLKGILRFRNSGDAERWAELGEQLSRHATELGANGGVDRATFGGVGFDLLRAATEGKQALSNARKEELVRFLQDYRQAVEHRKKLKESA